MISTRMSRYATGLVVAGLLRALSLAQTSTPIAAQAKPPDRPGIVLLAHGGAIAWNEEVRHVADQVDLCVPTEVAFGMATKSTMQSAVNQLVSRGATEIVAVPLFVSSHSSVIDSTAYLLGLRSQTPDDLKMFAAMDHDGSMEHHHRAPDPVKTTDGTKPIVSPVPVRMVSALDHDPIVASILEDRASSISTDPVNEVVILVAHGPVKEDENKLWLNDMSILAKDLGSRTHYAAIEYLTLRDDADPPVRNAAAEQLRQKVVQVTQSGKTVLVVPLLLSYGGIENSLRKRLSGLTYRMPSQGLLPDTRIVTWVMQSAQSAVPNTTAAQR
jgi:sirohydrochlorin ferrochelatase